MVTGIRQTGISLVESLFILYISYCSCDKIEKNEMCGACNTCGGRERGVQGFGEKHEGKRPLGRPTGRWEDNIKMTLQEVGCGDVEWIALAQDRDRWR
jgi:hypothetical protein